MPQNDVGKIDINLDCSSCQVEMNTLDAVDCDIYADLGIDRGKPNRSCIHANSINNVYSHMTAYIHHRLHW